MNCLWNGEMASHFTNRKENLLVDVNRLINFSKDACCGGRAAKLEFILRKKMLSEIHVETGGNARIRTNTKYYTWCII